PPPPGRRSRLSVRPTPLSHGPLRGPSDRAWRRLSPYHTRVCGRGPPPVGRPPGRVVPVRLIPRPPAHRAPGTTRRARPRGWGDCGGDATAWRRHHWPWGGGDEPPHGGYPDPDRLRTERMGPHPRRDGRDRGPQPRSPRESGLAALR